MGGLLLILFIVVPILEIGVFIQVGNWIGLWPTLGGIVMTALIGVALVRYQGFSVLKKAQSSVNEGRFPVAEVFDGLCLFIAGALLLMPGFLTDIVGFLLLVPPVRAILRRIVGSRMVASGRVKVWADGPPPASRNRGGIIIDADYEHVPEEPLHRKLDEPGPEEGADRRSGSPWRKGSPKGGPKDGIEREEGARSDERKPDGAQ